MTPGKLLSGDLFNLLSVFVRLFIYFILLVVRGWIIYPTHFGLGTTLAGWSNRKPCKIQWA